MGTMASQITSLTIVYSTGYSDTDQRKHQSSVSLVPGEFPAQMISNAENVDNVIMLCKLFVRLLQMISTT